MTNIETIALRVIVLDRRIDAVIDSMTTPRAEAACQERLTKALEARNRAVDALVEAKPSVRMEDLRALARAAHAAWDNKTTDGTLVAEDNGMLLAATLVEWLLLASSPSSAA